MEEERRRITVTEMVLVQGFYPDIGFEVRVSGLADEPEHLDITVQLRLAEWAHGEWNEQGFRLLAEAAERALQRGRSLRERVRMSLSREPIS